MEWERHWLMESCFDKSKKEEDGGRVVRGFGGWNYW